MTAMRKQIFICLSILTTLVACTGGQSYKIAVSQCASGQWREKVNREMLAAQHLYDQNVSVSIYDAQDDPTRQIQQIDSLSQTDIDLLVVAPTESAPMAEAIARVKAKGIPVIFFDRTADTDDYAAFIGGNNTEAGNAVGRYAVSLTRDVSGHRPRVLEVTAAMTTSPAQERHRGFAQAMQGHGEFDYVCVNSDWDAENTYKVLKQQIAAGQTPDIVFCHNDAMGMGAYKAVSEAKLQAKVKILGIDGMPDEGIAYVQQGKLAGTYVYPTHGDEIIRLALNILTHQPYERTNYMSSVMVTPDNANIIAMNSRELIKQNDDLITIQDKLENYFGLYKSQHRVLIGSFVSILLLVAALLLFWRAIKRTSRAAAETRKAHEQQKRLNDEQTRFYTNASHQLKTPLTLIAGPVGKLMDSPTLNGSDRSLMDIVSRNVSQLEGLVSNVLNFRKEMANMVSDASLAKDAPLPKDPKDLKDLKAPNTATDTEQLKEGRLAHLKQEDAEELSTILVVDDNADMRLYLRTLLGDKFYVLEANDGQSGLRIARELVPDLVVSDVMMPVMDGLQFCRRLKEDAITSHIPVILLTARSEESQQIEGYEHGADAYLTKPFSADVLVARIYNLLKSRRQLFENHDEREKGQEEEPVKLSTQDKLFTDALKEAIHKNMQNPNLKMDDLGDELGLSRVQLYRKVKALTGLSPVELLRQMRLQRGRTLLQTTTKTVNEIAYEVGFGTPGYFSSCFKKQYGQYPTDLRTGM
jgi:ABC-type sugar transport system substrate-binding protein/DNA-binding response OmpR family regulator